MYLLSLLMMKLIGDSRISQQNQFWLEVLATASVSHFSITK
uniref:Uncharacterized protein n=1 Tax=Rhizophora mucronata TaxID=61149 RepID=A0A2P2NK16_RHIMU